MAISSSTHACVRRAAGQLEREEDVLLGGQHRQQVEELKDEADVLAAQLGELAVAERGDRGPVDPHLARGRPVQPGQEMHERRLARARRAHDRGQLALGDRHRDAAQGVHGRVAGAVAAAEVTRGEADGRLRVLGRVLRAEKSVRQCFHGEAS